MIRTLKSYDAVQSARLHDTGMPDDFLSCFGMRFLQLLHHYLIQHPQVIPLGIFKKSRLTGIVIATKNTELTVNSIIKKHFFTLLPFIGYRFLTHPYTTLKFAWETLHYSTPPDTIKAEVLVLSVHSSSRHKGLGTRLWNQMKKEYRTAGISKFKVGTRVTYIVANNFYKKMGGTFIKRIRIYNRDWNVYVYKVKKSSTSVN